MFFRPTANELLKHPFFKKAKDKKYLQQTLVAIGPSLETRVQKVREHTDIVSSVIVLLFHFTHVLMGF